MPANGLPVSGATGCYGKIELLSDHRAKDLSSLVNFVQPGYFREKTKNMGDYFGIFRNHALIAVAGERMQMEGFTEISAVVTHPDWTGRGLAGQLVAHIANKNLLANRIPFLHVDKENTRAVALYEKLGFYTRRTMNFWKIRNY